MTGSVTVVRSGFFTTIQDEGRFGFSKYGVPSSGAMDKKSYGYANLIVGNKTNAACIEWTLQPPVLQFSKPTLIALSGAKIDAFLNDKKVDMYKQIQVNANDVLKLSACRKNMYGYISIKQGFLSPVVLDSSSFLKSITRKQRIETGDTISYNEIEYYNNQFATISIPAIERNTKELEVYKGIEFDLLSPAQKSILLNSEFTISNTINRMAIQLEENISNTIPPIFTSAVLPGTVQLTPLGTMIVLMRDCQTTGGYPRILQLTEDSINQIAQKRMKEKCSFKLVKFI
ncbi:biotin-dependent carboxyltransferase family protein [Aquimarina aquimarini]|uniref:5-oxoprolinase subunit C family protein n=1 Tax=Aquimarina aquimarini TaxID=1191734 RepID=UPI00131ED708|nr:biotin-dependent carboxyltransferase family protein [Aquimarina aquimarini]